MSDQFEVPQQYVVTLDGDQASHQSIANATGLDSKWFSSAEEFFKTDTSPLAVFICARIALEQKDNESVVANIKDNWPASPVILLTPPDNDELLTEAMSLGADDFVMRPLNSDEISNRLKVRLGALRRKAAKETINLGDLTIDTMQRSVTSHKGAKYLSPTEIKLISELARSCGSVVPRDQLKKRCWPDSKVSDNALNRKLYEVRRRLEPLSDQIAIRTIYGVGFILEDSRR